VIGVLLFITALAFGFILFLRRRRLRYSKHQNNETSAPIADRSSLGNVYTSEKQAIALDLDSGNTEVNNVGELESGTQRNIAQGYGMLQTMFANAEG